MKTHGGTASTSRAAKTKQARSALARRKYTKGGKPKKSVRFNVLLRFTPSEESLYRRCVARCKKEGFNLSRLQRDLRLKSHSCEDVIHESHQSDRTDPRSTNLWRSVTCLAPPSSPTKEHHNVLSSSSPHLIRAPTSSCCTPTQNLGRDAAFLPSCSFSISESQTPTKLGIARKPLSLASKRGLSCKNRTPTPRWAVHPTTSTRYGNSPAMANQNSFDTNAEAQGPSSRTGCQEFTAWRDTHAHSKHIVIDDLSVSIQDMQISPNSGRIYSVSGGGRGTSRCVSFLHTPMENEQRINMDPPSTNGRRACDRGNGSNGTEADTGLRGCEGHGFRLSDPKLYDSDNHTSFNIGSRYDTNNNSVDKKQHQEGPAKQDTGLDDDAAQTTKEQCERSGRNECEQVETVKSVNSLHDGGTSAEPEQGLQTGGGSNTTAQQEGEHTSTSPGPVDLDTNIISAIGDLLDERVSSSAPSVDPGLIVEALVNWAGENLELPDDFDGMIDEDFWRAVCQHASENSLSEETSEGNTTSHQDDVISLVSETSTPSSHDADSAMSRITSAAVTKSDFSNVNNGDFMDSHGATNNTDCLSQDQNQSSLLSSQVPSPEGAGTTLPESGCCTLPPLSSSSHHSASTSSTTYGGAEWSVATSEQNQQKEQHLETDATSCSSTASTESPTRPGAQTQPESQFDFKVELISTNPKSFVNNRKRHANVNDKNEPARATQTNTTTTPHVKTESTMHTESEPCNASLHLCPVLGCGLQFSEISLVDVHLNQMRHSPCNPLATCPDGVLPPSPVCFLCPTCGTSYHDEQACLEHMLERNHSRLLSPVPALVFACPECLRFFPTVLHARRHMDDLSHFGYAFYFPDDAQEPNRAQPIAVPERLMTELLERCGRVSHSLVCQDCGEGLATPEELRRHLDQRHILAAKCCTSVRDVFSDLLTDQACAECGQLIYQGLPSTGLGVHTGCAMQGPILAWPARTLREFVLRCGIAGVSVGTELTLDCGGGHTVGRCPTSPQALAGRAENGGACRVNTRRCLSETRALTADHNRHQFMDEAHERGGSGAARDIPKTYDRNPISTRQQPSLSRDNATPHQTEDVNRTVASHPELMQHPEDFSVASTSNEVTAMGVALGQASSSSTHKPGGSSHGEECPWPSESQMSCDTGSVYSSSSDYSVSSSLESCSYITGDGTDNDEEHEELDLNFIGRNMPVPENDRPGPEATSLSSQRMESISSHSRDETQSESSVTSIQSNCTRGYDKMGENKLLFSQSTPAAPALPLSEMTKDSTQSPAPQSNQLVFGLHASLDTHFYGPSTSCYRAPRFREQGTQVMVEDVSTGNIELAPSCAYGISGIAPAHNQISRLTTNIIHPSKTILISSNVNDVKERTDGEEIDVKSPSQRYVACVKRKRRTFDNSKHNTTRAKKRKRQHKPRTYFRYAAVRVQSSRYCTVDLGAAPPAEDEGKANVSTDSLSLALENQNMTLYRAVHYTNLSCVALKQVSDIAGSSLTISPASNGCSDGRAKQRLSATQKRRVRRQRNACTKRKKSEPRDKVGKRNRRPFRIRSYLNLNAAGENNEDTLCESIGESDRWCIRDPLTLQYDHVQSPELVESLYMLVDDIKWVPASQLLPNGECKRYSVKKTRSSALLCDNNGPQDVYDEHARSPQTVLNISTAEQVKSLDDHERPRQILSPAERLHERSLHLPEGVESRYCCTNKQYNPVEEESRYHIVNPKPKVTSAEIQSPTKEATENISDTFESKLPIPDGSRYFLLKAGSSNAVTKPLDHPVLGRSLKMSLGTRSSYSTEACYPFTPEQSKCDRISTSRSSRSAGILGSTTVTTGVVAAGGYCSDSAVAFGNRESFPLRSPFVLPKHARRLCMQSKRRADQDQLKAQKLSDEKHACTPVRFVDIGTCDEFNENDRFMAVDCVIVAQTANEVPSESDKMDTVEEEEIVDHENQNHMGSSEDDMRTETSYAPVYTTDVSQTGSAEGTLSYEPDNTIEDGALYIALSPISTEPKTHKLPVRVKDNTGPTTSTHSILGLITESTNSTQCKGSVTHDKLIPRPKTRSVALCNRKALLSKSLKRRCKNRKQKSKQNRVVKNSKPKTKSRKKTNQTACVQRNQVLLRRSTLRDRRKVQESRQERKAVPFTPKFIKADPKASRFITPRRLTNTTITKVISAADVKFENRDADTDDPAPDSTRLERNERPHTSKQRSQKLTEFQSKVRYSAVTDVTKPVKVQNSKPSTKLIGRALKKTSPPSIAAVISKLGISDNASPAISVTTPNGKTASKASPNTQTGRTTAGIAANQTLKATSTTQYHVTTNRSSSVGPKSKLSPLTKQSCGNPTKTIATCMVSTGTTTQLVERPATITSQATTSKRGTTVKSGPHTGMVSEKPHASNIPKPNVSNAANIKSSVTTTTSQTVGAAAEANTASTTKSNARTTPGQTAVPQPKSGAEDKANLSTSTVTNAVAKAKPKCETTTAKLNLGTARKPSVITEQKPSDGTTVKQLNFTTAAKQTAATATKTSHMTAVTTQAPPQLARSLLLSLDGPSSSRSSVLSRPSTTSTAGATTSTTESTKLTTTPAAYRRLRCHKLRTPKIQHLSSMTSIVFADLENFMFFKHFRGQLPPLTFVWGFVCARPCQPFHREKYFRKYELYRALKSNDCTHVSTDIGRGKDAVDFAMTLAIAKLDDRLPANIPFYIVSSDGGFREVENQMRRARRQVKVVAPRRHQLTVASLM